MKRAAPPADNGMADCFDSVKLDNPLSVRYYKNYSYNDCMSEGVAMCHADYCGCRDVMDPRKSPCCQMLVSITSTSHPIPDRRQSTIRAVN